MSTVHAVPVNDLIEHDNTGEACICGPDVEAVFRDDGTNGWLITHHSLDGREQHEELHDLDDVAQELGIDLDDDE